MRTISSRFAALGVLLAASAALLAQPPGPPPFPGKDMPTIMLLNQKSVQEELKLTSDQTQQLDAAMEKQKGLMDKAFKQNLNQAQRQKLMQDAMTAGDKAVKGILDTDQAKRFKEISLQQQGAASAFQTVAVAKELKLTAQQKARAQALQMQGMQQMMPRFQPGQPPPPPEEMHTKMLAMKKAVDEQAVKMLTAAQQTRWTQMLGDTFTGEIRMDPPPGGPGGPGGGFGPGGPKKKD